MLSDEISRLIIELYCKICFRIIKKRERCIPSCIIAVNYLVTYYLSLLSDKNFLEEVRGQI